MITFTRTVAVACMLALAAPAAVAFERPVATCQAMTAEEVFLVTGAERTSLQYALPQMRTAARAMGFGGVGMYASLRGPAATLRLKTNQPTFVLALPSNAQPENFYALARLEPRRNGTREVLIGGGYMSYSTGVSADRLTPMKAERAASQAGAPAGHTIYQLTPQAALGIGEYALIISSGAAAATAPGMPGGGGRFYDFGVDG